MQQRQAALQSAKQGKQEKLKIEGRSVSFFSTPDNSVRSFYVVDGDFHLVTTSRTIVEWFLGTQNGKHDSLGKSSGFRYARASMPITRDDTVFVYLAPQFFQNLLSPRYQIELNRRLRSDVEMQLMQVAQLSARAEGKPSDTIEALVAGGYLPAGFGQRPDGSRLEFVGGRFVDSLRGGSGTFVPIPDVAVTQATPAEVAEYRRFADEYTAQWGPMDPVVAGIRREPLPPGPGRGSLERVAIDFRPRHFRSGTLSG